MFAIIKVTKGTELCGLVHDHVDVHGDRHQRGLSAAVYRW